MPRFCGGSAVASTSSMTTLPASGTSSPAMTRSSVDLPEPDGPSSAVSDPDGISSETSWSASKSPKDLVMCCAVIKSLAPCAA